MTDRVQHKQALPIDYALNGYSVVSVLGVGGFGVTYLAEHMRLGHRVAIKEYLPNEFAMREGTTVHPKSEADRDSFEWGLALKLRSDPVNRRDSSDVVRQLPILRRRL